MHMMLTRRRLTIVALLILCSLVLGACQAIYAKGELTVDDWSRGERVGQTALNDFPAMVTTFALAMNLRFLQTFIIL